MNEYLEVLKKYTVFTGRSARREYWMFTLVSFIVTCIILLIEYAIHFPYLNIIYSLAVLLPSIGVAMRRLHDTNHSGWWLFIALIPLIGAIILLVFVIEDSTPGDNKYGPNPKGVPAAPAPLTPTPTV
jgi:uncharacterized membrane protein YhaH (DUF805 family)